MHPGILAETEKEVIDLKEQVAALESKEVCNCPHDDDVIEGCPYCRIEELNASIDRHMTRLQLEQSRTEQLSAENIVMKAILRTFDRMELYQHGFKAATPSEQIDGLLDGDKS